MAAHSADVPLRARLEEAAGDVVQIVRDAALTTGREEAIPAADHLAGGIAGRGRATRGAARERERV